MDAYCFLSIIWGRAAGGCNAWLVALGGLLDQDVLLGVAFPRAGITRFGGKVFMKCISSSQFLPCSTVQFSTVQYDGFTLRDRHSSHIGYSPLLSYWTDKYMIWYQKMIFKQNIDRISTNIRKIILKRFLK